MSDFMQYNDAFNQAWAAIEKHNADYRADMDHFDAILSQVLITKDYLRAAKDLESLTQRIRQRSAA